MEQISPEMMMQQQMLQQQMNQPISDIPIKDTQLIPYAAQTSPDLIKWQLDPADIVEELMHSLKGEVWSTLHGKYVKRYKPMMNEKGLNNLMGFLSIEISKIKILSNYKEEDVLKSSEEFNYILSDKLFIKYKEWEIDFSDLSTIRRMIGEAVFATLKRAENEGERRFLKLAERRIETHTSGEKTKSELPFPFRIFGGKK